MNYVGAPILGLLYRYVYLVADMLIQETRYMQCLLSRFEMQPGMSE